MRVPPSVEHKVVERLYKEAGDLDWSAQRGRTKTDQYAKWVNDPEIGGLLSAYGTEAEVRLWIKDGPMKAWNDAKNGVGRFAGYIDGSDSVPQQVVTAALGDGWEVVEGSIKTKPTRLFAAKNEEQKVIAWAPRSDFRHIVWAALSAVALGDATDWLLCVVETFTNPTPANEKVAHERIAKRVGLTVKHIRL